MSIDDQLARNRAVYRAMVFHEKAGGPIPVGQQPARPAPMAGQAIPQEAHPRPRRYPAPAATHERQGSALSIARDDTAAAAPPPIRPTETTPTVFSLSRPPTQTRDSAAPALQKHTSATDLRYPTPGESTRPRPAADSAAILSALARRLESEARLRPQPQSEEMNDL